MSSVHEVRRDYAGAVSRGVAFAIDVTLTTLAWTVGYVFVRAVSAVIGVMPTDIGREGEVWTFVAGQPIAFVVYCTWFWTLVGRTPGMMVLGVRVVTADGSTPSAFRSLCRALCYWFSAVIVIGFVWMVFDRRHQALHDKIAGTFVVYDSGTAAIGVRSGA